MSGKPSKGACLVIGAGDGVGGAIARAFALDGYETVVTRRARNLDQLESLAAGIRVTGQALVEFAGRRGELFEPPVALRLDGRSVTSDELLAAAARSEVVELRAEVRDAA